MMFVVKNRQGLYLALPERKRMGAWADVSPAGAEWVADIDCAARFETEHQGQRTAAAVGFASADIVSLREALLCA